MVSGGRIDHGHHNNTAKRALYETLAFEDAVKTALQMTNSSDTLIVVTADHSHVFNIGGHSYRGNNILGKFISALLFFRLRKIFFWTNWHIWFFNFFLLNNYWNGVLKGYPVIISMKNVLAQDTGYSTLWRKTTRNISITLYVFSILIRCCKPNCPRRTPRRWECLDHSKLRKRARIRLGLPEGPQHCRYQ